MIVELTWAEIALAGEVGILRRITSWAKGSTERFDPDYGDVWGREINGACAELAVAKKLGLYWGGMWRRTSFSLPDVGVLEVKHCDRSNGCLIVQREAPDETLYVLVTGVPPALTIRGYRRAGEAKLEQWWRADVPKPAYFVPQRELEAGLP